MIKLKWCLYDANYYVVHLQYAMIVFVHIPGGTQRNLQ